MSARLAWLYLVWLYRRWTLAFARDFRVRLETTIANERRRAQVAAELAETMEKRAEMDIIAARANNRIPVEQPR